MNKKTYMFNWCDAFFLLIELDHDQDIEKIFHQMNNFWGNSESLLKAYDGDIIKVGIKRIAEKAFMLIAEGCFNVQQFDAKRDN